MGCGFVAHGGALGLGVTQLIIGVIEVFVEWVSHSQRLVDMNSSRMSGICLDNKTQYEKTQLRFASVAIDNSRTWAKHMHFMKNTI